MEKAVEMKKVEQNQPENYINKVTFRDKLREYKKHPKSLVVMILVMLSAVFAVGILLFLMIYILVNGIPHLTAEQFEWKYTPENQSMTPAMINTLTMTLLTLLIAVPVGIFAAVYLVEYAKRGNKANPHRDRLQESQPAH